VTGIYLYNKETAGLRRGIGMEVPLTNEASLGEGGPRSMDFRFVEAFYILSRKIQD
jgi:hypothetical protein